MRDNYSYQKGVFTLQLENNKQLTLSVSKSILDEHKIIETSPPLDPSESSNKDLIKITLNDQIWKIKSKSSAGWRRWWINFQADAVIFPTREGEYISNLSKIPNYSSYNLTYPGTASTKCVVIINGNNNGFVIGSKSSLNWARISLTRVNDKYFLQFIQKDEELFIIPFTEDWKPAVIKFRENFIPLSKYKQPKKILATPRFSLQMGIKDFFGKTTIKDFSEILPLAKTFVDAVGKGNMIHLFGTNPFGFDCMFPDFSIDDSLGGYNSLKKTVSDLKKIGLLTSHHFNPRIADTRWVEKNPEFKSLIVKNHEGIPWVEFYKNNIYYVMDPSNETWMNLCLKTIKYLQDIGFDYVEIDQVAYQRNLATKNGGLAEGYQKLIDKVSKTGVKFWVEGVSDIFKLPEDCYFQVLPRDRSQFWETGENRRGYAYGTQYTTFYRTLMPHALISYQIVTEKAKVNLITKRLRLAKKLNAQIYDLELGFLDKNYTARLDKTLRQIKKFLKNEK